MSDKHNAGEIRSRLTLDTKDFVRNAKGAYGQIKAEGSKMQGQAAKDMQGMARMSREVMGANAANLSKSVRDTANGVSQATRTATGRLKRLEQAVKSAKLIPSKASNFEIIPVDKATADLSRISAKARESAQGISQSMQQMSINSGASMKSLSHKMSAELNRIAMDMQKVSGMKSLPMASGIQPQQLGELLSFISAQMELGNITSANAAHFAAFGMQLQGVGMNVTTVIAGMRTLIAMMNQVRTASTGAGAGLGQGLGQVGSSQSAMAGTASGLGQVVRAMRSYQAGARQSGRATEIFASAMDRARGRMRGLGENFRRSFTGVESTLRQATSGVDSFARNANRSFKDVQRVIQGILIAQGFYKLLSAIQDVIGAVAEMSQEIEKAEVAFGSLMKSPEAGKAFMAELEDFAADTPFTIKEAIDNARKLLAYGFNSQELMPLMYNIVDASAASGDDQAFSRIGIALGQIKTKGKLATQELLQLTEAGIPAFEILKDTLGLTRDQLDGIAKMKIPADVAINALLTGMQERYGGTAALLAKTLPGMLSAIKDNFLIIAKEGTTGIYEHMRGMAGEILVAMTTMREIVRNYGIGGLFEHLVPAELQDKIRLLIANLLNLKDTIAVVMHALWPLISLLGEIFMNVLNMVTPYINFLAREIAFVIMAVTQAEGAMRFFIGTLMGLVIAAALTGAVAKLRVAIMSLGIAKAIASGLLYLAGAIRVLMAAMRANPLVALMTMAAGAYLAYSVAGTKASKATDKLSASMAKAGGRDINDILQPVNKKTTSSVGELNSKIKEADKGLDKAGKGVDKVGDKAKKAGKKIKGALMSFDEVFLLPDALDDAGKALDDINKGGGLDGIGDGLPDLGMPEIPDMGGIPMPDISDMDMKAFDIAKEFANRLKGAFKNALIGAGLGAVIGGILGGIFGGVPGAILGAKMGAAIGAIVGYFWEDLVKLFKTPTGAVLGLGAVIGAVLGAVIGGPKGAAIGAILGAAAGLLAKQFWGFIAEKFGLPTANGMAIGAGIGAVLGGILGGPVVAVIGAGLGAGIGAIAGKFWELLANRFGMPVANGTFIGTGVGAALGMVFAGPGGAAVGAALGAATGAIVGKFWAVLADKFGKPAASGLLIGAGVGTALGMIFGGPIGAVIVGILGTVAGGIAGRFWGDMTKYFKSRVDAFTSGMAEVWGHVAAIFKRIVLGESAWWEIGRDIVLGILQGMVAIAQSIGGFLWEFIIMPIIDGFKKLFGIKSPAREMIPIGEFVMLGVLEGMKGKLGDVLGEAAGWAIQIKDSFLSWVSEVSTQFSNWCSDTLTGFVGWSSAAGQVIVGWATDGLGTVSRWWSETKTGFTDWKSTVGQTVTTWWNESKAGFTGWKAATASTLGGWWNETKTGFAGWRSTIIGTVTTWAADTAGRVATWSNNTKQSFSGWRTSVIGSITGFTGDSAAKISSFCSTTLSRLQGWWSTTRSGFSGWAKGIYREVMKTWDDLYNGIKKVWEKIKFWDKESSAATANINNNRDAAAPRTMSAGPSVMVAAPRLMNLDNLAGHAKGGIFNKEHIARFAEGGKPEAAIPTANPSDTKKVVSAMLDAGLYEALADIVNAGGGGRQTPVADERPILHVGTLIADERGLKELQRKMQVMEYQENARRGFNG